MGEEVGTAFDFGKTESTFLAVSIERKLAVYGGRKWPPQFRHSLTVWGWLSIESMIIEESGWLQ